MSLYLNTPISKLPIGSDSDRSTISRSLRCDTTRQASLNEDYDFNLIQIPPTQKRVSSTSRVLHIKMRHNNRITRKRLLKQILGKMILRKFLINKKVLKQILNLPAISKRIRISQKIGQNIIRKTKINLQTSFLRSILLINKNANIKNDDYDKTDKTLQDNKMICVENNITVYPYEQFSVKNQVRQAILYLQQCHKENLKKLVKKFATNIHKTALIKAYFARVTRNFNHHRHTFIRKLRLINTIQHKQILQTKRRILRDCLNRCLERRDKVLLEGLKSAMTKKLIQKNQYMQNLKEVLHRKLRTYFFDIKSFSYIKSLTSIPQKNEKPGQHNRKTTSTEEGAQIDKNTLYDQARDKNCEQKCVILEKVIKSIFFKVIVNKLENKKRLKNWERIAANKIACNPKISIFRSFYRLRANAKLLQNNHS